MTEFTDYLCDDVTGDLVIEFGDFAKGSSAGKHVIRAMKSPPGFSRRSPLVGIAAGDFKQASASKLPLLVKRATLQLEGLGFQQPTVIIDTNNEIKVYV